MFFLFYYQPVMTCTVQQYLQQLMSDIRISDKMKRPHMSPSSRMRILPSISDFYDYHLSTFCAEYFYEPGAETIRMHHKQKLLLVLQKNSLFCKKVTACIYIFFYTIFFQTNAMFTQPHRNLCTLSILDFLCPSTQIIVLYCTAMQIT